MRPMVFLHGGGQGGWVWRQTIASIERQSDTIAQCLALDAPGCGQKRGVDTQSYAFTDTTRELIADIQAAGFKDVMLVGHSQAGMTIPQMAQLAPAGLIGRIVYVSCSAPLSGMTTLDQMGEGPHGSNPDQVGYVLGRDATMNDRYRTMFCNDMDDAAATAFLALLGADGWPASAYRWNEWQYDHLRQIPSSYVLALQDQALPAAWQERFADRLHARRLHRIDAGHQVMNTRPEALAEILLAEARL